MTIEQNTISPICPATSVSLCMIVRDEAQVLKRCLENAIQFADEIIIVDTGLY